MDSSGFHWIPLEYLHKFGREKTNIQVDSSGFQVQFSFMEYSSRIPCSVAVAQLGSAWLG